MDTRISTQAVAAGQMPDVCGRHGEPAVQRRRLRLVSRAPVWTYLLLLLGILPFVIATLLVRKSVTASAWPFCVECAARRRRLLLICAGAFAGGLVLLFAGVAVQSSVKVLGAVGGIGFVVLVFVSAFAASLATPRSLTNARVTGDGIWVEVTNADPRFAEAARTLPPMPATSV